MPWIEAVHKFQYTVPPVDYTNTYNKAYFRIPAKKGAGNYIAWWIWSGYSDAIDVNVQPNYVTHRYGTNPANALSTSFTRVDHCEFNFWQNTLSGCRRVDPNTM